MTHDADFNIQAYYRKRATEYEEIYHRDDPVRQRELSQMARAIENLFVGKTVLEIAAGTGYWTQFASRSAQKIICTDAVEETLEIAKLKECKCPVEFKREDAYQLSFHDKSFDAGLAMFWFSHVPKEKYGEFFAEFHRVLKPGAVVFIADNVYDPEVGGKLVSRPGDANTYKLRQLKDGGEHLVLKNYFSEEELQGCFSKFDQEFGGENITFGQKYWWLQYRLK